MHQYITICLIPIKLHYTKFPVIRLTYLHAILLFSISPLHLQKTNIVSDPTNETDRLALLKFKELIANDPHKILSSWNDSIHFCNWMDLHAATSIKESQP